MLAAACRGLTLWWLDETGARIDGQALANSTLDTTRSVTFQITDFASGELAEPELGSTQLSFSPDRGFEMVNVFAVHPEGNRYVGHYDNDARKYKFYYAGTNAETYSGIQRTDFRLEMQLRGGDVILIETWAMLGSEDKRVQSYRLTRR